MEKRDVEETSERNRDTGEPASAATRMLRALNVAASSMTESNDEVDAAAKALVTELRRANHPPEQVLLQIKQILSEAGLKPSHGPPDSTHVFGRHIALYRTVIESSIRHYFAPDTDAKPTA